MVDKECLKRTGLSLKDFPTIWCEDFWPVSLDKEITTHQAHEVAENCIQEAINTL